ncbi:MAG: HrpE/YscL family type III secretion apparatus protein [Verrucomicrobiales bacterium]|nr:HrpE/YscL family type III secretion apparatus protein [Verrucomicrobiales bacterium]
MFRLAKSQLEFVENRAILPAREYAALVEAEGLIEAARAEAERIRREAEEEYAKRRAEGYEAGLEKGKAEIAERMVDYMGRSAAYFSKVEGVLIDVVMRAARRVIGEFDQKEVVERVVRRALEATRNEGHVTVRVAPALADDLKSRIGDILGGFPKVEFLEVVPDGRVPEGGCILETELGFVDASLETQFKAIEKALVNSMK